MTNLVADMTREELISIVSSTMDSRIADKMQEMGEKYEEVASEMKALRSSGTAGAARPHWLPARDSDRPPTIDGTRSVAELIDLEQQRASYLGGIPQRFAPTLGNRSRTAWMHDTRGLRTARAMRAMIASTLRGDGRTIDYERALLAARELDRDVDRSLHVSGVIEESRDLRAALEGGGIEQERAERTLGTLELGKGAGLLQTQVWGEMIGYLWDRLLVRALGVRRLPLKNMLEVLYWNTATSASYVGESVGGTPTDPGEAKLKFVRKILQGLAVLTRELIMEADVSVDDMLREMLLMSMGDREEQAFLRGTGGEHEPRGIGWWAEFAGNDVDRNLDTGTVTIDTITADARDFHVAFEENNVPRTDFEAMASIFPARDFWYLATVRAAAGNNNYLFPELLAGSWFGTRARVSNKLPTNLAGDASGNGTGNKSEILVVSAPTLAIAESPSVEVNVFPGGAYKDANGNVVPGINQREVVMEVAGHQDFGSLLRGLDCYRIKSVDYGAA